MRIERKGRLFDVEDDPETRRWNFWEDQFASGVWEPATLDAIGNILGPEDTFVDIGAWVGPTTLWAAGLCKWVHAYEPDPYAARVLRRNTRPYANVSVSELAVTPRNVGAQSLWRHSGSQGDGWGNSMSTLVRRDDAQDAIAVGTVALQGVIPDEIGLLKIDIEGGEGALIEECGDLLATIPCPLILALHLPWLDGGGTVMAKLRSWGKPIHVLGNGDPAFPTVLIS